jgi:hypothetical protein
MSICDAIESGRVDPALVEISPSNSRAFAAVTMIFQTDIFHITPAFIK